MLLLRAGESPSEKQEGGFKGSRLGVTPALVLDYPRGERGLYFWLVLQTDPASLTVNAWMFLGAESLRCCWRFVFAECQIGEGRFIWTNIDRQFSVQTVLAGGLLRTLRLWIPAAACLGDDYQGSS